MKKQFLETGKVVGTHGLRGEVRVQPWCDSPDFLADFNILYLNDTGTAHVTVTESRVHKNVVLMKLQGIDSIEQAETLRGKILYMNRDNVELSEEEWFVQDLIGCRVHHADTGAKLGILSDVSVTGANDVWHIKSQSGREYLIPVICDVVVSVDIEGRKALIRPLAGIFDGEEEICE